MTALAKPCSTRHAILRQRRKTADLRIVFERWKKTGIALPKFGGCRKPCYRFATDITSAAAFSEALPPA